MGSYGVSDVAFRLQNWIFSFEEIILKIFWFINAVFHVFHDSATDGAAWIFAYHLKPWPGFKPT